MSATATPAQACDVASTFYSGNSGGGPGCETLCKEANHGVGSGYYCTLPADYQAAFGDGGTDLDAGDGGVCPAWSESVVVQCGFLCLGRRTAGIAEPAPHDERSLGAIFAGRAYLEEVSVHAFARLERELAAYDAPPALLRDARRARRDEVRHTAMTAKLARRFGGSPRSPAAPAESPVRSLVAMAIENAVEGCVRETYGAVLGLLEAAETRDAAVAQTMRRIAADECRHAELSWAIAAWLTPRLTEAEREDVAAAMRGAVQALGRDGDVRIVEALDERVWSTAA